MDTPRVYWAARTYHSWWGPGNHHFILIRTLRPICGFAPVLHRGDGFMTLGAFNVNNVVTFQGNHFGDVQGMKRIVDQAPDWESWDIMKDQRVSRDGHAFACELVRRCLVFKSNTRTHPVPYDLLGDDCAPWIHTLLGECGISWDECKRLGKLDTYPQHRRLSFPEKMFRRHLPPGTQPQPGQPAKRIHVVEPGDWLSKIALKYYGDIHSWDKIYNHPDNLKEIGPNPDLIKPGQQLVIP